MNKKRNDKAKQFNFFSIKKLFHCFTYLCIFREFAKEIVIKLFFVLINVMNVYLHYKYN